MQSAETKESNGTKFKHWIQDNLPAIIIIIIAFVILFFLIYSYSKRAGNEDVIVDDTTQNEVIDEIESGDNNGENSNVNESGNENNSGTKVVVIKPDQKQDINNSSNQNENQIDRGKGPSNSTQSNVTKTDGTITITATYGDGMTHLARKATNQYILDNGINNLTPAHKIYIEDYVQKNTPATTIVPGTAISFSNSLIAEAVNSAQNLSPAQLQNLNNYASYVSNL
jgi:hypothetical protein